MKRKIVFAVLICAACSVGQPGPEAWAFTIKSPAPETRVEAGSIVAVSLDLENAGKLAGVMFSAYGERETLLGGSFVVQPPYHWTLQLPPDYTGPAVLRAKGNVLGAKSGDQPEATVSIYVKLPSSAVLQGISVRDDQKRIVTRTYTTRKLSVYGQFSDGVERDISAGQTGTTYTSDNKTIALVDADGVLTTRGPGRANITVRNGDRELALQVIVQLKP